MNIDKNNNILKQLSITDVDISTKDQWLKFFNNIGFESDYSNYYVGDGDGEKSIECFLIYNIDQKHNIMICVENQYLEIEVNTMEYDFNSPRIKWDCREDIIFYYNICVQILYYEKIKRQDILI